MLSGDADGLAGGDGWGVAGRGLAVLLLRAGRAGLGGVIRLEGAEGREGHDRWGWRNRRRQGEECRGRMYHECRMGELQKQSEERGKRIGRSIADDLSQQCAALSADCLPGAFANLPRSGSAIALTRFEMDARGRASPHTGGGRSEQSGTPTRAARPAARPQVAWNDREPKNGHPSQPAEAPVLRLPSTPTSKQTTVSE